MNGGSTVKANIPFLNMNVRDIVDEASEGMLRTAGEEGKVLMRKNMKHKDYTGTTRKSVTWKTKRSSGKVETDYELDAPATSDRVVIGSAAPNSSFIEYGTLGHLNPEGSAEFVREVTDWAMSKGIPEDRIYPIIQHIRENGTKAFPFAEQTTLDLNMLATQLGGEFVALFMQKMGYKTSRLTRGPIGA